MLGMGMARRSLCGQSLTSLTARVTAKADVKRQDMVLGFRSSSREKTLFYWWYHKQFHCNLVDVLSRASLAL